MLGDAVNRDVEAFPINLAMNFGPAVKSFCVKIKGSCRVASVAQLVEQLTLNQLVLGSSPSRGTISSRRFSLPRFKRSHSCPPAVYCCRRGSTQAAVHHSRLARAGRCGPSARFHLSPPPHHH